MRTWPALEIRAPSDLVQAALTDYDVAAIDETDASAWRVFFTTPAGRDAAAATLAARFPDLALVSVDVPDDDWAARSQASLRAITVGRLVVAPPWDVGATPPEPAMIIVIHPSMGFGTGHHATTRLCLLALQGLPLRGQRVLDVGTGSGVLAIAASRLGAAHVLALDDDPDAIESARENIGLNPGADVTLGVMDLRRTVLRPFDLVMANLTGALLVSAAGSLVALATTTGHLILSGFLDEEQPSVLAAFEGCRLVQQSAEDEWRCVVLARNG